MGKHGLIFLDADGGPVDLDYPWLPFTPDTPRPPAGLSPLVAVQQQLLLSLRHGETEEMLSLHVGYTVRLQVPGAADHLLPLTHDTDPLTVNQAFRGLLEFQDARAFPAAVQLILHGPTDCTAAAAYAVGDLRDPALARAIEPLAYAQDPFVRSPAVLALYWMGEPGQRAGAGLSPSGIPTPWSSTPP